MLTARDALKIARKLGAEITEGRNHTRVLIAIDDVGRRQLRSIEKFPGKES
jgi:hypothetical protein